MQPIAFGANGSYWYGTSNGTTTCDDDTLGVDPVYLVAKNCYTRTGPPPGYPVTCAAENATCAISGTRTIAYGADGDFVYQTVTGQTPCTNAAFGADPLPNAPKACYLTS